MPAPLPPNRAATAPSSTRSPRGAVVAGLIGAGLALLPICTPAASFDCRRAASTVEKAICADPALGRLDQSIADTYRRLLGQLAPEAQARVRRVQRDWLADRRPGEALRGQLQRRLDELEQALIPVDGLTLLRLGGSEFPPYLLSDRPGAVAYNRWVDTVLDQVEADHALRRRMAACDEHPQPLPPKLEEQCEGWESLGLGYSLRLASADMISIEEWHADYVWGAAHPNLSAAGINFWLSKPGRIIADEIFAAPGYKKVILQAARRYLAGLDERERSDEELEPALEPDHWTLTPQGLHITGDDYAFGLGHGQVSFVVPWADFKDSVRDEFRRRLAQARPVLDPRLRTDD